MGHSFQPAFLWQNSSHSLTVRRTFSQNVLGVANFDLTFAFGLFGWEGSAHDSRVFHDSKLKGLPIFPGKFYLGDGGYGLSEVILTPFKCVRYHLKEFDVNGPVNAKELFNLRHASLRNVIERMYGNIKRRFPVLVKMSPYDFDFQCDIVQCCFLRHNFIRLNQLYEDEFYREQEAEVNDMHLHDEPDDDDDLNMNALKAWRNGIANAMWAHYQIVLGQQDAL